VSCREGGANEPMEASLHPFPSGVKPASRQLTTLGTQPITAKPADRG